VLVFYRVVVSLEYSFEMRRQPVVSGVIELEEIGVQQIELGKSAMKVLFEEGKAFRLEIDDVSFQLIVVRKAVD